MACEDQRRRPSRRPASGVGRTLHGEGVDGLLRDKSRPPGTAPLEVDLVDRVVALTLETARLEATHWTVRAMAKAVGIAASSVVKIWHEHGLAPDRWRSFKLSNDKPFAEKLHDVVGLYVSPPGIAATNREGLVLAAKAFEDNPYDGHTLAATDRRPTGPQLPPRPCWRCDQCAARRRRPKSAPDPHGSRSLGCLVPASTPAENGEIGCFRPSSRVQKSTPSIQGRL